MRIRRRKLDDPRETLKPVKKDYGWLFVPLMLLFILWVFIPTTIGIISSGTKRRLILEDEIITACQDTPRRVEKYFPFYIFGCYLGGKEDEAFYYKW